MSEKEVDYGRMLTGLSGGISALYKHEHALKALRSKLMVIVDEIDMVLKEDFGKPAREWYEAISREHDAEIRARYEREHPAAADGSPK